MSNELAGCLHSVCCSQWLNVEVKTGMSDVPQSTLLGLVLFNNFVNNMDSEVKCALAKIANGTKPCGAVDTLEGRDIILGDLDRMRSAQT